MAERAVRAIVEGARTMLLSQLPKNLWDQACQTIAYAQNRTVAPGGSDKTRYEMYYGSKPDVSNLRVFGQLAVCRVPDPRQLKQRMSGGYH